MNRESCNGAITAATHKQGNHPPADRRSSQRVSLCAGTATVPLRWKKTSNDRGPRVHD
jgi:hypothetical protein